MSHKAHEAYSTANPVPKVALKNLFSPSSATERKANDFNEQMNQDQQHQNAATEKMTQRMVKGAEVDVKVSFLLVLIRLNYSPTTNLPPSLINLLFFIVFRILSRERKS